jgi:hypothetical protein
MHQLEARRKELTGLAGSSAPEPVHIGPAGEDVALSTKHQCACVRLLDLADHLLERSDERLAEEVEWRVVDYDGRQRTVALDSCGG